MDVHLNVRPIAPADALAGMRAPFVRAFGRGYPGRLIGRAAWSAFHAALLHDGGLRTAKSHALAAAEERNARSLLVLRWSPRLIEEAVRRATGIACDVG